MRDCSCWLRDRSRWMAGSSCVRDSASIPVLPHLLCSLVVSLMEVQSLCFCLFRIVAIPRFEVMRNPSISKHKLGGYSKKYMIQIFYLCRGSTSCCGCRRSWLGHSKEILWCLRASCARSCSSKQSLIRTIWRCHYSQRCMWSMEWLAFLGSAEECRICGFSHNVISIEIIDFHVELKQFLLQLTWYLMLFLQQIPSN